MSAVFPWATARLPKDYNYLAPDSSEIRLLPEANGGGLCHCTLPPGKVSQAMYYKTVEEIWYFISGQGQVWRKLGDKEAIIDVESSICLTIPTGTHFQFCNTGNSPLCFIITTMPKWPGAQEAVPTDGYWSS